MKTKQKLSLLKFKFCLRMNLRYFVVVIFTSNDLVSHAVKLGFSVDVFIIFSHNY